MSKLDKKERVNEISINTKVVRVEDIKLIKNTHRREWNNYFIK